jgi:hypothetical protein
VITLTRIKRLIQLRQEADSQRPEAPRIASAYHDELLLVGTELGNRPELLVIALDELVSEVAEARDAMERDQAARRGLIRTGLLQ